MLAICIAAGVLPIDRLDELSLETDVIESPGGAPVSVRSCYLTYITEALGLPEFVTIMSLRSEEYQILFPVLLRAVFFCQA